MRNGNIAFERVFGAEIPSSYRTYEEWKHTWEKLRGGERTRVLTVPMRNGN